MKATLATLTVEMLQSEEKRFDESNLHLSLDELPSDASVLNCDFFKRLLSAKHHSVKDLLFAKKAVAFFYFAQEVPLAHRRRLLEKLNPLMSLQSFGETILHFINQCRCTQSAALCATCLQAVADKEKGTPDLFLFCCEVIASLPLAALKELPHYIILRKRTKFSSLLAHYGLIVGAYRRTTNGLDSEKVYFISDSCLSSAVKSFFHIKIDFEGKLLELA